MRSKVHLTTIIALFATLGVIGLVETVGATPNESGQQPALGGRVFLVEVEVVSSILGDELPVGTVFPNCYFFDAGGTWIDPGFPVPGTWMQHSKGWTKHLKGWGHGPKGNNITYTAFAEDGLVLLQQGTVKAAHRKRPSRLEAFSTLLIGELKLAEFVSVGSEVDECPL